LVCAFGFGCGRTNQKIFTKLRSEVPHPRNWEGVQPGHRMRTARTKQMFQIIEITDTHVTIDSNHELAGQELVFEITLDGVAAPASEARRPNDLTENLMKARDAT